MGSGLVTLVLLGVTKVELVGQNALVAVAGPVCVLLGTVAVALLAAKFANDRMATQLDGANQRLGIELANDRRLRREEHQREALDATLQLANELHYSVEQAVNRLESVRTEYQRMGSATRPDIVAGIVDSQSKKLREELLVFDRVPEIRASAGPLKVRFGAKHAVPTAVEALADAWRDNSKDLRFAPNAKGNFPKMAEWRERINVSRQAFRNLLGASERWLEETDAVAMADPASPTQAHGQIESCPR